MAAGDSAGPIQKFAGDLRLGPVSYANSASYGS